MKFRNGIVLYKSSLLRAISVSICALFLSYLATSVISNPDIKNYNVLLKWCSIQHPCAVEPVFWVFADAANYTNTGLFGLYAVFIGATLFFISKSAAVVFGPSTVRSAIFPFVWFVCYGILHSLIQIRFGLAAAVALFAVTTVASRVTRLTLTSVAFFSHFSAALISIVAITRSRSLIFAIAINLFVACALLFLTSSMGLGLLPGFLSARLGGYLVESVGVSTFTIAFALVMYLHLMVAVSLKKLPADYAIAAVAFLPYFVTPAVEILIRLGVPFQYYLLILFVRDFKKRVLTLAPISLFFAFKCFGSLLYLISAIATS